MKSDNKQDNILLAKDVANQLHIHVVTIWRYIEQGIFPKPDLIIGKVKRAWYKTTIDNYIKEQEKKLREQKEHAA
ncbi:MAG: hypothetical protein E6Q33_02390 [Neisseriales bacterium]|nr:MAG: hypothetical protein E6Q33_02390 [Neisseriales bacterium]